MAILLSLHARHSSARQLTVAAAHLCSPLLVLLDYCSHQLFLLLYPSARHLYCSIDDATVRLPLLRSPFIACPCYFFLCSSSSFSLLSSPPACAAASLLLHTVVAPCPLSLLLSLHTRHASSSSACAYCSSASSSSSSAVQLALQHCSSLLLRLLCSVHLLRSAAPPVPARHLSCSCSPPLQLGSPAA